jgi:hypothetical protein
MTGTRPEPASALAAPPIAMLPDVGAFASGTRPEVRAKVANSGLPPWPKSGGKSPIPGENARRLPNLDRRVAESGGDRAELEVRTDLRATLGHTFQTVVRSARL